MAYDIITTEPEDRTVNTAYNVIIRGSAGVVPAPGGNYIFSTPDNSFMDGNGGVGQTTLVMVGHGSPRSLSGDSWSNYQSKFGRVNWHEKTQVYIVACSTAGFPSGDYPFFYQNFAAMVKASFPNATVWASVVTVQSSSLTGDWVQVT